MAEQNWKNLMIANVAMPGAVAAAAIATARSDRLYFLAWIGGAVVLLGLAVVNLVAPAILWKRHGHLALIPAATLVLAVLASNWATGLGTKVMLWRTPLSSTFLDRKTRQQLETVGHLLLRGRDASAWAQTLDNYGLTTDVDTARRVVTFRHYGRRTWTRFYFAPYGLPGPLASEPRITAQDVPDWDALRRIAKYAASGRTRGAHQFGFEALIGMPIVRAALGDSLLMLGDEPPSALTASMKARLIEALNKRCSADSRLIEHPNVAYGGAPRELWIEHMRVETGWGLSEQLKELIADGVISVAPDGHHFVLKSELTESERNRVAWLHAGILEFAFSGLLECHEYNYDQRVADHWYVWRM